MARQGCRAAPRRLLLLAVAVGLVVCSITPAEGGVASLRSDPARGRSENPQETGDRMTARLVFGNFLPLIRKTRVPSEYAVARKRMDMGLDGFHGDTFSSGFGDFSTTRRKRLMTSNGFYGGDTFSQGFGDFSTAKRNNQPAFHHDTFSEGFGDFSTV